MTTRNKTFKNQVAQLSLMALSLAMPIEAHSFDHASAQALLRRGATVAFSRGFQPTEARQRFPRRVATPDVSANQSKGLNADHAFARLGSYESNENKMLQTSLRDAGAIALRFRGLKPTAKVSRRSATKSDTRCGVGSQPALPAGLKTKLLLNDVGQVENLPHIALKTPVLYEQCAQPLAETAANTAHLAALKDGQKRVAAMAALAKGCEARAVEPLLELLHDKNADLRIAAAAALGQLGSVDSVDPMIESLSDPDARVRAQLGHSLGSFTVHRARNAVLNALVNPGGATISEAADLRARCFGILVVNQMIDVRFSRKAIGFLFGFLDISDPQLKAIAVATAEELQNTRNGLRELMGIIKVHNYPDFRRKSVYWLGRWGDPEARDLLTETAANDRDASVKAAAAEALGKLKK